MIIFDFDGVISDSVTWFDGVARDVSIRHRAREQEILEWMIAIASHPWLSGTWDDEQFVQELNKTFSIDVGIDEIGSSCASSIRIDPRVAALIESLGCITIFTDNPLIRARFIKASVPQARVTASQSVKARKHDDFEAFVSSSGIMSGLFIDDYPPNLEAARKAGFETLRWQLRKDPYEVLEARIREYEPTSLS